MGHSVAIPLDNHYGAFSEEALFEEYKNAIPELTISNEERQQLEIEQQEKKLSEFEQRNYEIQELKNQINAIQGQNESTKAMWVGEMRTVSKMIGSYKKEIEDLKKELKK